MGLAVCGFFIEGVAMKVLIEFDESTVAMLSELYRLWNWTGTLEDFAASSARIAVTDRLLSLLPIARELHG